VLNRRNGKKIVKLETIYEDRELVVYMTNDTMHHRQWWLTRWMERVIGCFLLDCDDM
jgi:hypothetical protein